MKWKSLQINFFINKFTPFQCSEFGVKDCDLFFLKQFTYQNPVVYQLSNNVRTVFCQNTYYTTNKAKTVLISITKQRGISIDQQCLRFCILFLKRCSSIKHTQTLLTEVDKIKIQFSQVQGKYQETLIKKSKKVAEERRLCDSVPPRLQYKTTMGKRLRNRQIKQETVPSQTKEKPSLQITKIKNNKLKKFIYKKFNSNTHHIKHLKFNERLKNGQISSVVDQSKLECPICLEIMVQPTMMICGHMYCFRCLQSNTAHSHKCCLCRRQQQDQPHQPSLLAQNLINNIFLPRSKEVIKYLCRTTDCNEWKKRRYLNNIRQGLVIDFQDSFNMWRRAVVMKIFYSDKEQKMMVTLKMNVKGTQMHETVQMGSKRIAPFKFFTRGRYLQQYSPSLPEYDYRQKQLYSLQYRRDRIDQQIYINQNEENNVDESQNQGGEEEEIFQRPQINESIMDQALVIFNLQMIENDLIY